MISWLLLATAIGLANPPATPDGELAATRTHVAVPVAESEVLAIPPDLKARLRAVVDRPSVSDIIKMQRLVRFLIADDGLGMRYEAGATYTVAQAYAARKANCLTFTLMVVALAGEVGLRATPQEEGETLLWQQINGTVYRENHINAVIHVGSHRYTVDPAADQVVLAQPPVLVDRARLLAHYYDNVAVDALQAGATDAAVRNVTVALTLDPGYAPVWSNAGVMFLHAGNVNAAENAYRRALMLDPSNASALFNMVQLLQGKDDPREREYRQRLALVEQRDPLQQLLEGLDFERAGELGPAIVKVSHAIQLKHDEPRFYAVLARLYERAGDVKRARAALWVAQSLSSGVARLQYEDERARLAAVAKQ